MPRLPLLLALFALACAQAPVDPCPTTTAKPGDVSVVASGLKGTEGIAFSPDGQLFVAAGNEVLEVMPDGTHKPFASVPRTVGMAWWGDALYVAAGDDGTNAPGQFCQSTKRGAVWKVTSDGQASVFATGFIAPNFLAVSPWGSLLVSDDCAANNKVWAIDREGHVSVWLEGVPSPNGLAFNMAGDTLFAATTWLDAPPVWKVPVDSDFRAGTPVKIATYTSDSAPDGLTVDADGNVYVSLNPKGEVHRITPDGKESLFAEGVMTTASLAFGAGDGFNPCTIYSTSLLGDDLYAIYAGTPGLSLRR